MPKSSNVALVNARRSATRAILWALIVSGAGCAGLPQGKLFSQIASAPAFSLQGRLAVKYGEESLTGALDWKHAAERDVLTLATPLGNDIARIVRTPQEVELVTARQEVHRATSVEALTQQTLGWTLPLSDLTAWVRGRAAPGGEPLIARDAAQRATEIAQHGWRVSYVYADAQTPQPRRIVLQLPEAASGRPTLELRLVIDEWTERQQ